MNIYFLSGLGADSRAFKYLQIPVQHKLIFLDWLVPEKKESLESYAQRMSEKIDRSEPFILVGLSFGGILAMEILNFVMPVRTILISSIARRQELPLHYRMAGALKLNKLIPSKAANKAGWLTYRLFGIREAKDKALLNDILTSTNTAFSKWAVNALLNWKRNSTPGGIIRIHGSKDRLLPIRRCSPDYIIKNAGHFMIVNRADEISEILVAEINTAI